MIQKIVTDQRFAFADLLLVLASAAAGVIKPEVGFWLLSLAAVPWLVRLLAGRSLFQRTPFDWPMLIFLLTAVVAYFTAYDRAASAEKFFFLLVSILLYYALCSQPKENYAAVAAVFFIIGVGLSLYHFLTNDFVNNPTDIGVINRIGLWLIAIRPELAWRPIPSGYVPGLAIITTSFVTYWLINSDKTSGRLLRWMVFGCFVIIGLAILSVKSASVWFALGTTAGLWVLWRLFVLNGLEKNKSGLFPWLVLFYLMLVITCLYIFDPIASAHPNKFGSNSRTEVFVRGLNFVRDFPISGAGLASFPGLYSQYMLGIPYFYISNSYNLFLDVTIEQGLLGGLVFLFIYLGSIFQISRKIQNQELKIQHWLVMLILIFAFIHGLMQDYLYNGVGTALLFFPVAMSMLLENNSALTAPAISAAWGGGIFTHNRILAAWATMIFVVFISALLGFHNFESVWYSNWGAVQLADVELNNFPEAGWPGVGIIPKLHDAETSFQNALRFDPENLTANYRLGLTYMLYRDFKSASKYLETAYAEAPSHRGIKKSLGYSYLWMGEVDKAQILLAELPEINGELDAYYWWWDVQDRDDLSNAAYALLGRLNSTVAQP